MVCASGRSFVQSSHTSWPNRGVAPFSVEVVVAVAVVEQFCISSHSSSSSIISGTAILGVLLAPVLLLIISVAVIPTALLVGPVIVRFYK